MRRLAQLLTLVVCLLPAVALAEEPADTYAEAAARYKAGDWQSAADAFENLLNAQPGENAAAEVSGRAALAGSAHFFCGEALAQLEKYEAAREHYDALLRLEPSHRRAKQALFRKGETAMLANMQPAARADFELFRATHAGDELEAYVLPYLGELDLADENFAAAEEHLTEALQRFPAGPLADEARISLGRAKQRLNKSGEALALYRLVADNKNAALADRANYYYGLLKNDSGEYAEAIETLSAFDSRFADSPWRDRARLALAWARYKQGEFAEAARILAPLEQSVALRTEAQYWRGLCLKSLGQTDEAIALLKQAAGDTKHSLSTASSYHAAEALLAAGRADDAGKQFQATLDASPESRFADECRYGLLRILLGQGKTSEAIAGANRFLSDFADSPLKPDVRSLLMQAFISDGQYSAAIRQAQGASSTRDLSLLSEAYAREKDWANAQTTLTKLARLSGSEAIWADAALRVADIARQAGNVSSAQSLYRDLAKSAPSEIKARAVAALAWSEIEPRDAANYNLDSAVADFDRLLREHPDDRLAAETALAQGEALETAGSTAKAIERYELIVQRFSNYPQIAPAQLRVARLYLQDGQIEKAESVYQSLLDGKASDEATEAALSGLARLHEVAGRSDKALICWRRLREQHPKSRFAADATFKLAEVAFESKHFAEAERLCGELGDQGLDREFAAAARMLQSKSLLAEQRWDEARETLQPLVDAKPASKQALTARFWVGECEYRLGKYAASLATLELALRDGAGSGEPWLPAAELRKAQTLGQLDRWKEAIETARKIESAYPSFARLYEADYVIGRGLAADGDFEPARQAYLRVLRSTSGGQSETAAMAQWMIGETFFHQEEYETAIHAYLQVARKFAFPRWQAGALLQAGKCHEKRGQFAAAMSVYQEQLKQYPDTEFSAEAARRLELLEQRASAARGEDR